VIRVADDAFELEPAQPNGFNMRLYRNVQLHPMRVGERIITRSITIEVLQVQTGNPTRIRVSGQQSMDAPSLFFAARYQGRLVRFSLPPIGGSMVLM
jgi:hypothetical protein